MKDNALMEYLCPHCLMVNKHKQSGLSSRRKESVRCLNCLSKFEILIAPGLNGALNVVVEDISDSS